MHDPISVLMSPGRPGGEADFRFFRGLGRIWSYGYSFDEGDLMTYGWTEWLHAQSGCFGGSVTLLA